MKAGYIRAIRFALALSVITIAAIFAVIYDFTIVTSYPVPYLITFSAFIILTCLMLSKYLTLPLLRRFGIPGGMLISPFFLFLSSLIAAYYYLAAEVKGSINENSLLALITSLSAVVFFASMIIFSFPALAIISEGFDEKQKEKFRVGRVRNIIVISSAVISLLILGTKIIIPFHTISLVLFHPILALFMIISFVILYGEFRSELRMTVSSENDIIAKTRSNYFNKAPMGLFSSTLLFQSHYPEIISGNLDYLINEADDIYAGNLVHAALRDFDPALIPALNMIAVKSRFGESIRHEAAGAVYTIEKYFSSPQKNNDMIIQSGLTERTVNYRSLLLSNRVPQVTEVLKLLHDSKPEIRRIGLAAVGRFRMIDLLEEVIEALSLSGTEKEAYYLLKYFGPDIYNKMVDVCMKSPGNEMMSLMVIRLLESASNPESISSLSLYVNQGPLGVRLKAANYLRESGFAPSAGQKQKMTETCLELIGNLARIIAFQLTARREEFFLLEQALAREREINTELLYAILPFLIGSNAAGLLNKQIADGSLYSVRLAGEIIDTVVKEPLRGPLLALAANKSDTGRLGELAAFYPLKKVSPNTLAQQILSADQNIAGIWTRACTLRKVAEGRLQADKELIISFLFSGRTILQEEGAGAIRTLNPAWYGEVINRISDQAKQKISAIIMQSQPEVTMIFNKTRFLNLCFQGIPEERLISLASMMRYTESFDAQSIPGLLSWIVPAGNGKSGLYSLSISDITDFIFHFYEYTDIFVNYIDKPERDAVSQN